MVIPALDDAAGPGKTGRDSVTGQTPGISCAARLFRHLHRLETKYRSLIRDVLRFLLVLCFLGFFFLLDDFVSYSTVPPSLLHFLGQILFVAVPALVCYLLLVRIEAEQWALVHPVFMNALGVIRVDKDYKKILFVVNLFFFVMVAISVLSGYIFSRSGQQFFVLCISVGAAINLMAFWFLGPRKRR
jgi:hypothetical protein